MDESDTVLIEALRRDGRLSFRDLADRVGLSPNAVAERVRRLTETGTIRAIRADIDPAALGRRLFAYVDVRMQPGVRADDFERALRDVPNVLSAALTTGRFDFTLHVGCADQSALVHLIETLRTRCGAHETYSRIVLRETSFEPGEGSAVRQIV